MSAGKSRSSHCHRLSLTCTLAECRYLSVLSRIVTALATVLFPPCRGRADVSYLAACMHICGVNCRRLKFRPYPLPKDDVATNHNNFCLLRRGQVGPQRSGLALRGGSSRQRPAPRALVALAVSAYALRWPGCSPQPWVCVCVCERLNLGRITTDIDNSGEPGNPAVPPQ
jgi:hypothetical protein